jgi:vacuolar-type H+-ATPase subunit I/STV1
VSLNCFSQTSTNNQSQNQVTSDTTRVKLKPSTARLAIKDIVKGEGCEQELKLTQEKIIKLEARETQKDTIISLLESKDKNSQFIISQQGLQIDEFRNMTNDLKKEIKQANTRTFLYKVGTVVGVLTTSYLLIVR